MNSILYAVKFFIFCYLALLTILYFLQRELIYYPLKARPLLGELRGVYTEVETQTKEGIKLTHWYARQGSPYIIVFHGNAGSIEGRCLVAGEAEMIYKVEKTKEELWDKYYTQAPAQRRQLVERYKIVKRA